MGAKVSEHLQAMYAQFTAKMAEGDVENAELILKEAEDIKAKAVREQDLLKRAQALTELPASENKQPGSAEAKTSYDGMDEWMGSIATFLTKGQPDPRLRLWNDVGDSSLRLYNEQKQMVENVGASGGFLVPPEQSMEIMSLVGENAIVRNRATIIRMARRQYNRTVLDQTGTTAGQPHWYGGMVFYWGDEAAEKTITTAKWREVSLVAKKLYGYTRASDELNDDSIISLSDFLNSDMGMAGGIAWMEDYAFLNGTGVGQPLGVINAPATITVARQVQQSVTYEDLTRMLEAHMETNNSIWVASISLKNVLMNMTYPTGNPSLVWQPNARDGMPGTLFGRPLFWTEKVPLVGSAGDIGLYDFKHYWLGDRQAITLASTNAEYFKYDQISWRMVRRVDGRPWLNVPITLQDGTSQISPFVVLGAKTT
jgi:HK97 family phage major capsid protein